MGERKLWNDRKQHLKISQLNNLSDILTTCRPSSITQMVSFWSNIAHFVVLENIYTPTTDSIGYSRERGRAKEIPERRGVG